MNPTIETLSIRGIEAMQEGVKGACVEPVQLKPGLVSGRLTFADTGAGVLTFGEVSGDIRLRGPLSEETLTLGVLTKVTGVTSQWGQQTHEGDFGIFPANVEHEAVYSADTNYLTATLPVDDLNNWTEGYPSPIKKGVWTTGSMYRTDPTQMGRLLDRGRAVVSKVQNEPSILSFPAALAAMMDEFVGAFCESIGKAGSFTDVISDRCSAPHALVRRAEDFCLAQEGAHARIGDICNQLSVSERTLRRAFISVVGLPPTVYLRNLRLTRVRRQLLENRELQLRVSDIAMQNGFWELGRFAADYRKLFGELPSQTQMK